jgi:Emfourin
VVGGEAIALLHVERVGGQANFGGAGAHVRSHGQIETDALSPEERRAVEALFKSKGKTKASQMRDGFRYRISRTTPEGTETIEVPEAAVPAALAQSVKDELV